MTPRRVKRRYVCQECGAETPKWLGRCPACASWNSLVEEPERRPSGGGPARPSVDPVALQSVQADGETRASFGLPEFDRVLGGGLVPGSLILLGGEPGIGKSTLLLQAAGMFGRRHGTVLYVTGEESPGQIRLRAQRLGVESESILVLAESSVEAVVEQVQRTTPGLLIVDSIQTMVRDGIEAAPGSVAQVRESAAHLMRAAKERELPVFLVGHVTKQGTLAGPKVLEHVVDVVLQFEGEPHTPYRLLRSTKNRYGSTHELGVFEMATAGLKQVDNPSAAFLAERPQGSPGSIVVASMEGSRPLLVEVQALAGPTPFGGTPRRQASGVDPQRVAIVLAVLERRNGMRLQTQDIYVNVAGGVRVEEPAADLGIALAVASSVQNRAVDPHAVVFGEVGLSGEVRAVRQPDRRAFEAAKLGFRHCLLPNGNRKSIAPDADIGCTGVTSVADALKAALGDRLRREA